MTQHDVGCRLVGGPCGTLLEPIDSLFDPSESDERIPHAQQECRIAGPGIEEKPGLFVSFRELAFAIQYAEVIAPRLDVIRSKFNAALQQELGVVIDPQAYRNLRQQSHRFDVVRIVLEEAAAESLSLEQSTLVHEIHDGEKFWR